MQVEVILQVAEESFNAIGRGWYLGIYQVVEHVRQSPLDSVVRTPQQFVRVPVPTRDWIISLLLQINLVLFMPLD